MSVLHRKVSATGQVFSHNVRVRGVQLTAGTSVAFHPGTDNTADPVVVAIGSGVVQELPGCGVEAEGLYAEVAGAGVAILYYD